MHTAPRISSLIDKAVHDYAMLSDGDRVLIGVSGGKDSTLLAEYLAMRTKRAGASFTITAVNIQSDFAPPFPQEIAALLDGWGVPFKTIRVDIQAQVKAGKKMNCWWCSTRRRGELLAAALQGGYNKIALGHHMDDILETLLMNALEKGELDTMLPNFAYSKYPIRVIRPLCYVSERRIKEYAASRGWTEYTCTCNYQSNSARKTARHALEALTGGDDKKKAMLFKALHNINSAYLP